MDQVRACANFPFTFEIDKFCSFTGVSGEILAEFGYEAIYGSASILHVIAIIYAFTFVKESDKIRAAKGLPERNVRRTNEKASCGSIFTFKHIKESFSVAFKRRPGGLRHVIVICVSLFGIYSLANNGISSINIPYAKAQFEWNNGTDESSSGTDSFTKEYAKIQSIGKGIFFFVKVNCLLNGIFDLSVGTVFNLFAIGVLMPIMTQVLKLSDLTITAFCVFSSFSGITTILLAGLAGHYKYLYLANAFRMFSDVTTVGIRSALSKLVGSSDVGKVGC